MQCMYGGCAQWVVQVHNLVLLSGVYGGASRRPPPPATALVVGAVWCMMCTAQGVLAIVETDIAFPLCLASLVLSEPHAG